MAKEKLNPLDEVDHESLAGSGVDFSTLPSGVQRSVVNGLFEKSHEWQPLSAFLKAPPERRLAAIRELKGLTQAAVAKRAGIRQADVSAAEKNVADSRLGTLRKIAQVLGLRISEVLDDHPSGPAEE